MDSLSAANMAGPIVAGILILIVTLFGIVMFVAWTVLPFAMIGTKPLLRELIAETKRTNALLESAACARGRASDVASELNTIRPER